MKYRIVHKTHYNYSEPASLCHNEARLTPRTFSHQTCSLSNFTLKPLPSYQSKREDFFGNNVFYFTIDQPHEDLSVSVVSEVNVEPREKKEFTYEEGNITWEMVVDKIRDPQEPESLSARPYALDSPFVAASPDLKDYALPSFTQTRPVLEVVSELMTRIYHDFTYKPGFTTISTPLTEVLKHRTGVCQDFAHLAIGCLRSFGLAARYVSGYIETLPPEGKKRLVGADASHAWFSVYVPLVGWLDFDPTNNQVPYEQHITVAWGRDYYDVAPLKGVVFGGSTHNLSVSVDVESLNRISPAT